MRLALYDKPLVYAENRSQSSKHIEKNDCHNLWSWRMQQILLIATNEYVTWGAIESIRDYVRVRLARLGNRAHE
jgi:hypothetical protein